MADKTGKPTGLTVNRKKNKLVVEWKIGDADYKDGQELYYVLRYIDHPMGAPSGFWKPYDIKVWADVKNSASKFVYSIKESDYFPNTAKRLLAVDFAVRGNRKKYEKKGKNINPTWSDYAKKTFDINPPSKPSVSASFNASEEITTRFTASAKDTDHAPYTRMVWESILVKNASSTDGSKYKWASGQMGWKTGTSQSLSHTETVTESGIAVTATTSYTRFFRAKAQGMGGESAWSYSYHVYGASAKPSAVSPRVSRLDGNMVLDIRVNTPQSASHPIDNSGIKVQYRAEKPDEGLALPSGDSWTEAGTRNNTAKKNSDYFHFDLGSMLADDNCLWYRIGSTHDGKTTWSDPYLRYIGYLPNPTITQIVPNFESHSVEFRANNASEIADSYLVGVCKVDGQDETIIASSDTGGGDKTFYGTIPSGATADTTAFGVRAVVGTLSGSTVKPYSGKLVMDSRKTVWKDDQGRLPIPPSGVSAVKASVEETAEISWQWSWNDADAVQITWSDNPLAWESNEEPSEYTVTRLNAGHWYISGLESGVRWYFRLRFMKGDGDNAVYSAWSEMVSIDLRSAPNKPTLMLSEYVIPADATITAYWAYVTTDGTPQRYAEICEAIVEEDSPIEYGETIAQTETAQHIDIDPSDLGWTDGEEHYLCVKVQSASGITSEGWSDPVQLKIAEKPVAVIAEDSLEQQSIEIHPQTFTGDMVQIENPDGVLEATSVRMGFEPVQDGTPWIDSTVESAPYTSRAMSDVSTRVGSHESLRKIIGGTVAWNQLVPINSTDQSKTKNGVTVTDNRDGSWTFYTDSNGATATVMVQLTQVANGVISGHKYAILGLKERVNSVWSVGDWYNGVLQPVGERANCITVSTGNGRLDARLRVYENAVITTPITIAPQYFDLTAMFGSTIADYIYSLEQANAGAGVAWFRKLFPKPYYAYNAGELLSVEGLESHNTVGFNQWDEEWEVGTINSSTGQDVSATNKIRSKNYIPVIPSAVYHLHVGSTSSDIDYVYFYDADKTFVRSNFSSHGASWDWNFTVPGNAYYMRFIVRNTTYNNDICINLSNPDRNGEYEPYSAHTYDLDDSLTLRGIPKLDSNNDLYYDGDTYESDGTVTRKYGVVDLGTLTWTKWTGSYHGFYATPPCANGVGAASLYSGVCTKYTPRTYGDVVNGTVDKSFSIANTTHLIYINDSAYDSATAAEFKTAMSGVYLVYELATPTTESAASYTEIQSIENGGTETFVGAGIPVGHESTYSQVYPISGHDSASVVVAGRNLFDGEYDVMYRLPEPIPKGTWVTASAKTSGNTQIYYYDENQAQIDYFTLNQTDPNDSSRKYRTFKISQYESQAVPYYIKFTSASATEMQFELSFENALPTEYEAPETYTTSLGRTVYGGTVDLVSGVLTVDRAMVDLGTLNWRVGSTSGGGAPRMVGALADAKGAPTGSEIPNMLCSKYQTVSANQTYNRVTGVSDNIGGGVVVVFDPNYTDPVAFKAAMSGTMLCYELAIPQTYQLTPQAIALLTGDNNVWSDRSMTIRVADAVEQGDVLTRLPLELTVTGAGAGRTVVAIERIEPYDMDRPDETRLRGNEGETVALTSQDGEAQISVGTDSRLGYLDDGARYQIVAMVKDAYGQASEKVYKPFLVRWEHQAVMPDGTVEIDGLIAKLTPSAPSDVPTGWQMADGDHIDIYRLSADRPVLVYPNAKIGETYVDPYPAIGGGYRFVFISKDGDYICTDEDGNEKAAWTDVESEFEYDRMILDFGGDRAELYYNVDEDDDWGKDFQATKYMSGRIVGDWNAGIEHTGDVNAVVITIIDDEVVSAMRRLAEYEGAVHVRTTSGASYDADVQVRRSKSHSHFGTRYSYSLSITRIDTGEYDGIPLALYESEESE